MGWIAEKRKIRIATIGLGFGSAVHVPAILKQENAEFVCLIGRNKEKTEKHLTYLNLHPSLACVSLRDALKKKPDLLTVALPPDQNESVINEAANEGCAILCEKPLAKDLETAERLVRSTERIPTAIDFQFSESMKMAEIHEFWTFSRF